MEKYAIIILFSFFIGMYVFAKEQNPIERTNCNCKNYSIIHQIDSIIDYDIHIYEIEDKEQYYDTDVIIYQSKDTIIKNPCRVNLSKIDHYQICVKKNAVPDNKNYVIEYNSRKYMFKTDISNCLFRIDQTTLMLDRDSLDYKQEPNWLFIYHKGIMTGKILFYRDAVFYNQYN